METNVSDYLQHNPDFLDNYIMQNVPSDVIQRWLRRKENVSQIFATNKNTEIAHDSKWQPGQKSHDLIIIGTLPTRDINQCEGRVSCALVFYRDKGEAEFTNADKLLAREVSLWAVAALEHQRQVGELSGHRHQNEFLLGVARAMFHDMVSMDVLIMKIMNFAQKLVDADRASLFLVDHKRRELYASIFDVGLGAPDNILLNSSHAKEIRFPMDTGIAGHVATTGLPLNISDAYGDPRFNRQVDSATGYVTKTILCMPIFMRSHTIGVVEMVNKRGTKQQGNTVNSATNHCEPQFTSSDEKAFEAFAVYCGLALHQAKLLDRVKRSEQKHKVALEVLAYHSVCSQEEVDKLKAVPMPEKVHNIDSFEYNALKLDEVQKPLYAVYMFRELFGFKSFDQDEVLRFVLTVRKNYRQVAYHNWTHGWTVAQAMYVILANDINAEQSVWTPMERVCMYVSSLCHDLDHRGKTNAFMKSSLSPLAAVYSTSVMEQHHFKQTVTILQHDKHNIFKAFSAAQYKWILRNMKHCILASDLAQFFPNKTKLATLVEGGSLNWEQGEHRLLAQALSITAADLVASAKPWQVHRDTVDAIFEEFYEQGDVERASGREPAAMMDRRQRRQLPSMQAAFMQSICVPCYSLLAACLPHLPPLTHKAAYNMRKWQQLAQAQDT